MTEKIKRNEDNEFPKIEKSCRNYYDRLAFTETLRKEPNLEQIITELIKKTEDELESQHKRIAAMKENPNSHIYDPNTGKIEANPRYKEIDFDIHISSCLNTLYRINNIIFYIKYPEYIYHLPDVETDIRNYLITR
jgi:hypothetical protein